MTRLQNRLTTGLHLIMIENKMNESGIIPDSFIFHFRLDFIQCTGAC